MRIAPRLSVVPFFLVGLFWDAQGIARAQSTPPQPETSAHETRTGSEATGSDETTASAPTSAPSPPAPTATPPAPAAIPLQTVVAGVPIRLTGIVHAAAIGSQPVESFGLPTAVAPTSALNPVYLASPDDPILTFQIQQTRLGMTLGDDRGFKGQVEIDFVHFDQSSPTTQAFPRIRIGVLEWHFAEKQKLFFGQTWDLFGNATGPQLLSHSSNLVGTLFQAGNIGFMRQQMGWTGQFGEVELGLAAGLQGANTGPSFNNIEESFTPTGSARVMLHVGNAGVVGVSGLGTALRFTSPGMPEQRRLALGGELFADLTFGSVNVHAEAYLAQNLANLGALNLGQGRYGTDVRDAGGYLSARWNLGSHALTAMVGGAFVLNPGDVVPGYAPAAMGVTAPITPNLALGPGMQWNTTAHLGYWYSPLTGLSFVLEPYVYATRFAQDSTFSETGKQDRMAWGAQLVSMYQF